MTGVREIPLSVQPVAAPGVDSAQNILDTAPFGFIAARPDGTLTAVNATFASWTGRSRLALLGGTRFEDLLVGPDRQTYETRFVTQLHTQGYVRDLVFHLEQADGNLLQILVSASLSRDDQGRPLAVQFIVFDATDRVIREEELQIARNEAQQLAAIVMSSSDAIISLGLDLVVLTWNPAATRLFGYTEAEAVGRSAGKLLVPAERRGKGAHLYEAVLAGQTASIEEGMCLRKDGSLTPVEVSFSPIRDLGGDVSAISVILRDITDRKRVDTVLREREARLRLILDSASAFIGVMEPDGTVIEANATALEAGGLVRNDVIGRKLWDTYWYSYEPRVMAHLKDAVRRACSGDVVRFDVVARMANDTRTTIDFTLAPVFDDHGNVELLVPSGVDITDRERGEAALRRSHDTYLNLIENNPFGVYLVDSNFRMAQLSVGAQPAFATVKPLVGRDFAEIVRVMWPIVFADEVIGHFRHTLATGEPYRSNDMREVRGDIDAVESYDWKIERVTLPGGDFGIVCYFYDMSERTRHEEHISLLMNEVNHRAKNLLGVVQAVARQTARTGDPETFVLRLSDRIAGLTESHDLLVKNQWRGVEVSDLVRGQLSHFEDLFGTRVFFEGNPVRLNPSAAQGIGMALHELATNAGKYGALSNAGGCVRVTWTVDPGPDPRFIMTWSETGGPRVVTPEKIGFGQTVMVRMAEYAVQGTVDLDYAATGLSWRLTAPLHKIREAL